MTLTRKGLKPSAATRLAAPAVTFWGVRGSLPVPGPATQTYGGNTTCLEIEAPSPDGVRRFIVDAGSGIFGLGASRDWSDAQRIDILLTHLHHDHIIGLPFFQPLFRKDAEIHIWCGNLDGETAEAALDQMFAPPLFPLRLSQFAAKVVHHGFRSGETLSIDGVPIRTVPLNHPSGATGYRFDGPEGSLAIITDIEHGDAAPCPRVTEICRDVDTLVYDSMLDEADYGRCRGWGHSTISAAALLAEAANARRLVGCHHAPGHDDAMVAARERRLAAERPDSLMAREGMRLVCSRGSGARDGR